MKFRRLLLFFFVSMLSLNVIFGSEIETNKKFTISGKIKDVLTGEELIGATIFIKELKTGVNTNIYGFYSITIPEGKYNVVYSYIGYEPIEKSINLTSNMKIDLEMSTKQQNISEVIVTGERKNDNVEKAEMSLVKMKMSEIKKIPALMGEVDIVKAIQMLPGVQSAGEGSSGFSVRGGATDHNLILLDEATVYNASHLMGFFSVFNNDAIKDVTLYKGDIPAAYGGRLASLLDVRQKDGNLKTISGTGGIGTISSRLTIEGPIIKDKCSFIIAGRRSYADLFLPLSSNEDVKNNKLYFYDLNAKINYTINNNNRIFFSSYFGRDVIKIGKEDPFKISWGNSTFSLRWNHLFSAKLFSNFTLLKSNYDYILESTQSVQGFKWTSDLQDYSLKADFGYYLNTNNTIKFGVSSSLHKFQPGTAEGQGDNTIFNKLEVPKLDALEHSFYVSNDQKLTSLLNINYGVRYSIFQNIGSATVYNFDDNFNSIDSSVYKKGEIFNTYDGIEPRVSLKYTLTETSSLKSSYSRTYQFVHLASNSTVGTPLDVWIPSSQNVKPQYSDQVAMGYFRNLKKNIIETSVEVYYKKLYNQIDFKDHASILLNTKLEGELRFGEGEAYGAEFLARKQSGKLTGWISYTISKSERMFKDINNGKKYRSPYDKTHNAYIVLSYELTKRMSLSANWVYSSGAPVTFPTGRFEYGNKVAPVYSDRNSYRMPNYHRMDISLNIDGKKKEGRRFQGSWNFSIYNVYSRHNAYQISFRQSKEDPNITEAYKVYLFPLIPSVTYNFKF
ncbi:MAG: collagen-binding protein [Bacteroidetes bacterium GWF2_29_10]|nr:MAG: collagen-binding protein [Bacteroidetes bacterium GWF2_29_10]